MSTPETTTPTREETARLRLRAQKAEHEKAMREAGMDAGHAFVLDTEEQDDVYVQMTALTRYCYCHDHPEDLGDLIAAMNGSDTCLPNWFQEHYATDSDEPAWVTGFVAGALAKFREVAPVVQRTNAHQD